LSSTEGAEPRHLARYGDVDLALGGVDIDALRAFFQQWMTEL